MTAELWLAADRREPSSADAADAGSGSGRSPRSSTRSVCRPRPSSTSSPNARVFFVESRRRRPDSRPRPRTARRRASVRRPAGGVRLRDHALRGRRPSVAGRSRGRRPSGPCVACAARTPSSAADGDRLILRADVDSPSRGFASRRRPRTSCRPYAGERFATGEPDADGADDRRARAAWDRRVRGWLEVAPATARDEPPTKPSGERDRGVSRAGRGARWASASRRARLGPGRRQSRGGASSGPRAPFRVVQDGRTWRGRVVVVVLGRAQDRARLAAPASSYEWQQLRLQGDRRLAARRRG